MESLYQPCKNLFIFSSFYFSNKIIITLKRDTMNGARVGNARGRITQISQVSNVNGLGTIQVWIGRNIPRDDGVTVVVKKQDLYGSCVDLKRFYGFD